LLYEPSGSTGYGRNRGGGGSGCVGGMITVARGVVLSRGPAVTTITIGDTPRTLPALLCTGAGSVVVL
jgi:hypothetical protein